VLFRGEQGVHTSLFLLELFSLFFLSASLAPSLTFVFLSISYGVLLIFDQFLPFLLSVLESSLDLGFPVIAIASSIGLSLLEQTSKSLELALVTLDFLLFLLDFVLNLSYFTS